MGCHCSKSTSPQEKSPLDDTNGKSTEGNNTEAVVEIMIKYRRKNVIIAEPLILELNEISLQESMLCIDSKTKEEMILINSALDSHLLFSSLDQSQKDVVIQLMKKDKIEKGKYLFLQGDPGNNFYIVSSGCFNVIVDNQVVSKVVRGGNFGELALLYNCPRAATVQCCEENAEVYWIGRIEFRQTIAQNVIENRMQIQHSLKNVKILQSLTDEQVSTIAEEVQVLHFQENDQIIKKGEIGKIFYMIDKGQVQCCDFEELNEKGNGNGNKRGKEKVTGKKTSGNDSKEKAAGQPARSVGKSAVEQNGQPVILGEGEYFGERALMMDELRTANVFALTAVKLFALDRTSFNELLGPFRQILDTNLLIRTLKRLERFQSLTDENIKTIASTANFISFPPDTTLQLEPFCLYVIKEGKAISHCKKSTSKIMSISDSFGDVDSNNTKKGRQPFEVLTITKLDCFLISLKEVNQYLATDTIGAIGGAIGGEIGGAIGGEIGGAIGGAIGGGVVGGGVVEAEPTEESCTISSTSIVSSTVSRTCSSQDIKMEDLEEVAILGTGTFGIVRLVRHLPTNQPYSIKSMWKSQIEQNEQQAHILSERKLLGQLSSPFILKLKATFKDAKRVHLLTEYLSGGELFGKIVDKKGYPTPLTQEDAKFYSACVLLALEKMHQQNIAYRDLKPENILLDNKGYAKLVDLGFAKVIEERSYTLCGTPEYLAPEMVLAFGHNKGVDYWALGVLIYEMIVGDSPFCDNSNDHMIICGNIVTGDVKFPAKSNPEWKSIVKAFLKKKTRRRLGCTKEGIQLIKQHPWYSSINWEALSQLQLSPPLVPQLSNPFDTSNFPSISPMELRDCLEWENSPVSNCTWDEDF